MTTHGYQTTVKAKYSNLTNVFTQRFNTRVIVGQIIGNYLFLFCMRP